MTLGLVEILLVVLVFVVLGPRRIADLFRSLGRGVHDFVENLGREKENKELPSAEQEEHDTPPK